MLLFYLCDIVRNDVIWLLKPFVLYLKAKADKSLFLSLGCYLNCSELSWPFCTQGTWKGTSCSADSDLLLSLESLHV